MTTKNESELTPLAATCEKYGISFSFIHLYYDPPTESEIADCRKRYGYKPPGDDKWSFIVSFNGRSESFDLSTGIGHRKLRKHIKNERGGYYDTLSRQFYSEGEAIKNGILTPQAPTKLNEQAESLGSYLRCAEASRQSFNDWCSEYGANNDSIKERNIYDKCQESGDKLNKLFGHALVNELSSLRYE